MQTATINTSPTCLFQGLKTCQKLLLQQPSSQMQALN